MMSVQVVSWCTREEWSRLSTLVCSIPDEPNNAPKLELAISMLNCLMSRLPSPPIGAQMTSELLQAFLATVNGSDQRKSQLNRPTMAFSIIRFVNFVSHAFQDPAGFGVQPLHKMAAAQNVPDWLVTLRHDATHGALPADHLLRAAMLAALQWTITAYWQQQQASPDDEDPTEADAASLQQLETMLSGPRGRYLHKSLLSSCLSSETRRQLALQAVADAMVSSYAQLKGGVRQTSVLQSWVSAISAVCRCDLLTELLESLLTCCPAGTGRHQRQAAAALWVEQLTLAAQRDRSDPTPDSPGRPAEAALTRQLAEAVSQAGPVRWSHLVETALRHKNAATARILPLLMDGLSPPLPERRREILLQLVRIASGAEPPARQPVRVGAEELRRLGIRLPTAAAEPADGATPAPPGGATVAPPTDDCGPSWRRCADGPQWREATEVGRLPWQQKTPVLLDAVDASRGGLLA